MDDNCVLYVVGLEIVCRYGGCLFFVICKYLLYIYVFVEVLCGRYRLVDWIILILNNILLVVYLGCDVVGCVLVCV